MNFEVVGLHTSTTITSCHVPLMMARKHIIQLTVPWYLHLLSMQNQGPQQDPSFF